MPVQVNSKLWHSYKRKDWKLSSQYEEYSKSNKKKFIICLSIFVAGFMWAFLTDGSLWLSFIVGIAFAVLPSAVCFAFAVVNRNSIFGGLRKAISLGLELNKSYGVFSWKQVTHYGIFHCEEQFEYSLIREIVVFPKRNSLLIFTGGYSSSYLTGELPKTVRYYPTSEHPLQVGGF